MEKLSLRKGGGEGGTAGTCVGGVKDSLGM